MIAIEFNIKKKVQFGQALYVIGNIPEIGNWSIFQSFSLNWNQNHIWSGKVIISTQSLRLVERIQYKYIISSWKNPSTEFCIWQSGYRNRLIDTMMLSSSQTLNEQWNMNRIKINIITKKYIKDAKMSNSNYYVIGSCKQLGNWKIKKPLRLQYNLNSKIIRKLSQKIPKSEIRQFLKNQLTFDVYSTSILIPRDQRRFKYYFIKQNDQIEIQRHPGRVFDLFKQKYPHRFAVINQCGFTSIYDNQNFDKPTLSKITPSIYLGSYLKNQNDLKDLKKIGIQAIYSIQAESDEQDHKISPLYLQLLCKEYGIEFKCIQIQDKNSNDFIRKSKIAIQQIDKFIKDGKTTYVYCTAGKYRSPQIIALYLTLKQGLNVYEAIKFVQQKHPVARPSQKLIKHAIYHIQTQKQIYQRSKYIQNSAN